MQGIYTFFRSQLETDQIIFIQNYEGEQIHKYINRVLKS